MAECRDSSVNNTNGQKQPVVLGHHDSTTESKTEKAMEPMLIEDFKGFFVPLSFQKAQQSLIQKSYVPNKNDELILIMHILMLETGFVVNDDEENFEDATFNFNYKQLLHYASRLPKTWKKNNILYKLSYVIQPFKQYVCNLVITAFSDDLLVNCFVENIEGESYSLLIDPSLYIMSSTVHIQNKFQNMSHLSSLFKTSISNCARTLILRYNNLKAFCLQDMPPEIMVKILGYFNPKTLAMFESTCRYFRSLSNDPVIWRKISGAKWESFQYFKKTENARLKLEVVLRKLDMTRYLHY